MNADIKNPVGFVYRAGDGTTTSTLLTQEIVNQGMRLVTSGANPVELRQGILAASGMIIEEIKSLARPVGKNEVRCARHGWMGVCGRGGFVVCFLFPCAPERETRAVRMPTVECSGCALGL